MTVKLSPKAPQDECFAIAEGIVVRTKPGSAAAVVVPWGRVPSIVESAIAASPEFAAAIEGALVRANPS